MKNFNLIDDPWIPVRWLPSSSDTSPLVSLETAFTRGNEIADLDCSPSERISIIRLLICITHAALGMPEDANEWDEFADDLETATSEYLRRTDIHPHFALLGDGTRFLQEKLPTTTEPVPSSKLFPPLATGNNPTLLDHSGMLPRRNYHPSEIALALLTFQNFYPLYGAGYRGRGPCAENNAIHCMLLAGNLRGTILSNLIDKNSIDPIIAGRPIWECSEKNHLDESTTTLLGRLVPRHRSLQLTDDLSGFYHRQESLLYPGWEGFREPSVTAILDAKQKRRLLPARRDRSLWRDLHSLTALRAATTGNDLNDDAAPVLRSQEERLRSGESQLWTGALITDLKAKILDTLESSFTVNHSLLTPAGNDIYSSGTEYAETISKKLFGAIKTYGSSLKHENPPIEEGQKYFWHILDQNHRTLINLASDPESQLGRPAVGSPGADDLWTKAVHRAALDAYQTVCPATTPRQIQAYAAGIKPLMRALYPKMKKSAIKAASKQTAQPSLNL